MINDFKASFSKVKNPTPLTKKQEKWNASFYKIN